ncbi:MAG: transglutaminaseTgpA domain-containing protein, partial [Actinomycetes bacterium]
MKNDTRLGLALLVALVAQLWPWTQLTRDGNALRLAALAIAVVLAVGWAGRRLRLPTGMLALVQLATVVLCAMGALAWAHGPGLVTRLPTVMLEGIDFFRGSAAPLFPQAGATVSIVGFVALLAMLADWVALTWERPGWAVLPLAVMYLVVGLGLA